MPDHKPKPGIRKPRVVGMQLDDIRVEMSTWNALRARAKSHHFIVREAGRILDAWAEGALRMIDPPESPPETTEKPIKPGRGGKRAGAGRPRKNPV